MHLFYSLHLGLKAGERPGHITYFLDPAAFCPFEHTLTSGCNTAIAPRTLGLLSTDFPFTWAGLVWAVKCWSLQLTGGCSPTSRVGATITPNLPLPVFQLSMTNEHFGNSFRHTHNPLSWCQQQKLMTVWIAGRQKMHYNGQQSCYPLQEGGVGAGCCINWKAQSSFVLLQTWDEAQGERTGSEPMEMPVRGSGMGGIWPWFLHAWHWSTGPCLCLPRSTGLSDWPGGAKWHPALPAERVSESLQTETTLSLV